jgi:hypothetical protein
MPLYPLYPFSRSVLRQTEQPVTFYFWCWLGCGVLLVLCRIALCLALQIGFSFLGWLSYLETAWYGVRLAFSGLAYVLLPPLLYRSIFYGARAAGLTTTKKPPTRNACWRLSIWLHGLRWLPCLPLAACLYGVQWCLQQGTTVSDALWWVLGAVQFVTLGVVCLVGWLWLCPALAAAPVLLALSPQSGIVTLRQAFRMVSGKRRQWYALFLRSLPLWLLPFCLPRVLMMQTVWVGILQKELQYHEEKGWQMHGANSEMACGGGNACHIGILPAKRKTSLPPVIGEAETS